MSSEEKSDKKSDEKKSKPKKVEKSTRDVGLSASKVVALIGALVAVKDGISLFSTVNALNIIGGILAILFGAVIMLSLDILKIEKLKIPYNWWILLIMAALMLLFNILAVGSFTGAAFTGALLVLIAAIVELTTGKRSMAASKLVSLIGAGWTIYASVLLFFSPTALNIIMGIIGLILGVAVILAVQSIKLGFKIPYEWWVILIIGFVLYFWVNIAGGTIILVAFVLILMAK